MQTYLYLKSTFEPQIKNTEVRNVVAPLISDSLIDPSAFTSGDGYEGCE